MKEKNEKQEASIVLNARRNIYVYDGKEVDFIKSSNIPHLNVEDQKDWESYNTSDDNPNLIGQIRITQDGVRLHLCWNPSGKFLTKDDLKAIIQGIEYIEEFIRKKER